MKCLRCGYCCIQLTVAIIHPNYTSIPSVNELSENHIVFKEHGVICPHLLFDDSCAICRIPKKPLYLYTVDSKDFILIEGNPDDAIEKWYAMNEITPLKVDKLFPNQVKNSWRIATKVDWEKKKKSYKDKGFYKKKDIDMNNVAMNYLNNIQEEDDNISYTKGDLDNHHAVAAIVYDKTNKKILMQEHIKLNLWTIPIGKVDNNDSLHDSLKRELLEETGISLIKFKEVDSITNKYVTQHKWISVVAHIFEVSKYKGIPRNLEPKKHKQQKFVNINDIKKLGTLSDVTKRVIVYLNNK